MLAKKPSSVIINGTKLTYFKYNQIQKMVSVQLPGGSGTIIINYKKGEGGWN